jgi:hypothetical protein
MPAVLSASRARAARHRPSVNGNVLKWPGERQVGAAVENACTASGSGCWSRIIQRGS